MATLKKSFTRDGWRKIDLPGGDFLEVRVQLPTHQQQRRMQALRTIDYRLDSADAGEACTEFQLTTAIVDWRGVQDDDGKPVPFTWPNVNAMCDQRVPLFYALLDLAREAFVGITGDREKNLQPPCGASPAATPETPTASGPTSSPAISS